MKDIWNSNCHIGCIRLNERGAHALRGLWWCNDEVRTERVNDKTCRFVTWKQRKIWEAHLDVKRAAMGRQCGWHRMTN